MKNHEPMKAADTYHSIYLYTFIASYKNIRLKKRIGTDTNTYTHELHGKTSRFDAVHIFSDIFKILSFHCFRCQNCDKANIVSFLELYSKRTMPNEIYDVHFPKQTKTLVDG